MIDRDTYDEKMLLKGGDASNATMSSIDVDNSTPVARQIDNSAAEAILTPEEREQRHREALSVMNSPEMQAYYKLRRRHECNPFNAHFYDKEIITEEKIRDRVKRAAEFFELPVPIMIGKCESLAKITFTNATELGSEIQYSVKKLHDIGINNLDAFDAMLTHELSHQFLEGKRFNFCRNRKWSVELACDFIVGIRCSVDKIASGKYKYAVSVMKASPTHPAGSFRLEAVKKGFEFAEWLFRKKRKPTAHSALLGITRFLSVYSKALNEAYHKFLTAPETVTTKPKDIMDYPNSNLLKQAILKTRLKNKKGGKDETI